MIGPWNPLLILFGASCISNDFAIVSSEKTKFLTQIAATYQIPHITPPRFWLTFPTCGKRKNKKIKYTRCAQQFCGGQKLRYNVLIAPTHLMFRKAALWRKNQLMLYFTVAVDLDASLLLPVHFFPFVRPSILGFVTPRLTLKLGPFHTRICCRSFKTGFVQFLWISRRRPCSS